MSKENIQKQQIEKPNRIAQFLNTEYKWENFLLVGLSLFAIVFGVLILQDTFSIPEDAFLVGPFANIFAWVLIVLGVISLLLWAVPFFRPSISEIKHIKGLKRKEFLGNIVKVIAFTIALALVFFLFDLAIEVIISWL
jgi:preprotein translocase SecE subunit